MQEYSITTFNEMHRRVSSLYEKFAPAEVKYRKNSHLAKQTDTVLLTCYLFGIQFPSRTRFIRTCNNLKQTLELINQGLVKENVPADEQIDIIDSLPVPLCQPMRNFRAKGASELANIGFNATKQVWFYGLKFHAIVNQSGLILNFLLSSASFHDAKVCEDLLDGFHLPILIGDAGYIGKDLARRCAEQGTSLIAIPRSNMKQNGMNYQAIKVIRKKVETVFSGLQLFGIEHLKAHQLKSIMTRIQLTVLLYNL